MGFLDDMKKQAEELKDRASDFVGQHGDKITEGLDKVASKIDSGTQGKYSGKIQSGAAKAKEAVHRFGDGDKDAQN
ncbi:MAG TPA: antitoxin [Pseudonocardiaceae bacterium]|jgi:hypothetical protein|nr:antitoxin [Pseudonocardiaceae bacterium]